MNKKNEGIEGMKPGVPCKENQINHYKKEAMRLSEEIRVERNKLKACEAERDSLKLDLRNMEGIKKENIKFRLQKDPIVYEEEIQSKSDSLRIMASHIKELLTLCAKGEFGWKEREFKSYKNLKNHYEYEDELKNIPLVSDKITCLEEEIGNLKEYNLVLRKKVTDIKAVTTKEAAKLEADLTKSIEKIVKAKEIVQREINEYGNSSELVELIEVLRELGDN